MKLNKTQTALGVAAVLAAGALAAPTASADARVEALEAQVNQMSQMLQEMQGELNRVRDSASRAASENTAKVMELDEWAASVKSAPAEAKSRDNMAFFRGGWARNNNNRGFSNNQDLLAGSPFSGQSNETDQEGWYFGAALDFSINDDLFGLMQNTEMLAELGVEYKEISSGKTNNTLHDAFNYILANNNNPANVQLSPATVTVNQLTLSVSPKIKFLKGSDFRPWLIPIGFDLNVISPPAGSITVLNPGMQFALGADYRIWDNIFVGADARYHQTLDNSDGVDTDGFTLGGYIGLGF